MFLVTINNQTAVREIMMKMRWIIGVMACAAAFGAQAQYKYIGPDGKVVYSDQPPPPNAKVLEKKGPGSGSSSGGGELPFALQKAVKSAPVTLYTAGNCGAACTEARSYLNKRGVPFAEKTVNTADDAVKFKKDLATDQLPVMTVGSTKQVQWQQDAWATALTAAGYPADNQLPQGYKNPGPVAMAPAAPAAPPANQTASNQPPVAPASPPADAPAAPAGDKPAWFKGF